MIRETVDLFGIKESHINLRIRKIYITQEAADDRLTLALLDEYSKAEIIYIDKENSGVFSGETSKDTLLITHSRGKVFKPCPGTSRDYLCCNYYVINQTQNCPLDCTYCILRYYVNGPGFTVYSNTEEILREVAENLENNRKKIIRVGTGELTDSLALPAAREFGLRLVSEIGKFPNAIIELKTKTAMIEPLIEQPFRERIVLSWSLNPQVVIDHEEFKTASLSERLYAARQAVENGFLVGFHFDPLLRIEDFELKYVNVIEELFAMIAPEKIAWISLGSLRFPPETKLKIAAQFPGTRIIYDEFVRGMDGKLRYAKPVREEMYRIIYRELRKRGGDDVFVYFCMESSDVWRHIMGFSFKSNQEFEYQFARSLYRRYGYMFKNKPVKDIYLAGQDKE